MPRDARLLNGLNVEGLRRRSILVPLRRRTDTVSWAAWSDSGALTPPVRANACWSACLKMAARRNCHHFVRNSTHSRKFPGNSHTETKFEFRPVVSVSYPPRPGAGYPSLSITAWSTCQLPIPPRSRSVRKIHQALTETREYTASMNMLRGAVGRVGGAMFGGARDALTGENWEGQHAHAEQLEAMGACNLLAEAQPRTREHAACHCALLPAHAPG